MAATPKMRCGYLPTIAIAAVLAVAGAAIPTLVTKPAKGTSTKMRHERIPSGNTGKEEDPFLKYAVDGARSEQLKVSFVIIWTNADFGDKLKRKPRTCPLVEPPFPD